MNVPEINEVKDTLSQLKSDLTIKNWELPYENLLTRLSAAIFFIEPSDPGAIDRCWEKLSHFENFTYRENTEKKLSNLKYRIEFKAE